MARSTLLLLIFVALSMKMLLFHGDDEAQRLGLWYSVVVTGYLACRFCVSYLYLPADVDATYHPSVSVIVPCKNEEDAIRKTICCIAQSSYPSALLDICVINDGSTDGSMSEIENARDELAELDVGLTVVNWSESRGKREAMAEGIRQTNGEILVFIDSDSFLDTDAVSHLVAPFAHRRVGAVSGHTDVYNRDTNRLTMMQAVRYHLSFRIHKASEGALGGVSCCSGCNAAYRREYLAPLLDQWLHQRFLGVQCTYGDDRSLTNLLLANGYVTTYSAKARAATIVPEDMKIYLRQQLRWRKSWFRESLIASSFIWKRNPLLSMLFYAGFLLPLVSPVVVIYSLVYQPLVLHIFPWTYLTGLLIVTAIYATYYRLHHHREDGWLLGALLLTASSVLMFWQLPWAVLRLVDGSWGTR